MFCTRLYFHLKPFAPQPLRIAVRRWLTRRQLEQVGGIWPILPGSERPPEGWPGWPDGKQFAFVLTHDVESQRGLDRVKQLAELEMSLGFRSSFNFIPEGSYSVPPGLRSWLVENGFEVGIHDLHHDGKLYSSREEFRRKARRINRYAKEWNAVGFRSGFMLNRLEWLHDLNVYYDASTFDTDPFEPQPEGTGTIFPFWVSLLEGARSEPGSQEPDLPPSSDLRSSEARSKRGYVELPYTLPQDSTLFLMMGERSIEIWKQKLDWIVRNGGLALVNIHPDYIDFSGTRRSRNNYPAERVIEFLEHVSTRYRENAWTPIPRELATWYHPAVSRSPLSTPGSGARAPFTGMRAAVLLYSYYPSDPRPRRAAEALVGAGMEVDLVCLSESESQPQQEIVNGVHVFRMPLQRKRHSKLGYLKQYGHFIARCFGFLARRVPSRHYDLVHVHNMPDVLAFAALPAKLDRARIVLDLHDPMPELMMSIYRLGENDWFVRALRVLEKLSLRFADLALTPNLAFQRLFVSRSCAPEKMRIVMNSPESQIFDVDRFTDSAGPHPDFAGEVLRSPSSSPAPSNCGVSAPAANQTIPRTEEFRIMHHGSIVHRHGVDVLVRAVARVRREIPGIRLDIYGRRTGFLDKVLETARELGVDGAVHYHGPKPQSEIARAIWECHLGVVSNRRSPFTELNFPTRLFEYLAMHRPVIAPATRGIGDYFGSGELVTFEPDDVEDLARKILWVKANPGAVREVVERGHQVYLRNLWSGEKAQFLAGVTEILRGSTEEAPLELALPAAAAKPPGEPAVEL